MSRKLKKKQQLPNNERVLNNLESQKQQKKIRARTKLQKNNHIKNSRSQKKNLNPKIVFKKYARKKRSKKISKIINQKIKVSRNLKK